MGEEENKKKKKAKEIAEKYRLSLLSDLDKRELLKENTELKVQSEVKDAKIFELQKKVEYYKGLLNNKPKYSEYNPDFGGIEKVIYILKENARVMLSNQIEAALLELEPDLKLEWENTRINTSRYISRAVKAGRVVKHYIGNGFTYGLPEWFEDDGNLIKKFSIV